jgi:hypothetical protein
LVSLEKYKYLAEQQKNDNIDDSIELIDTFKGYDDIIKRMANSKLSRLAVSHGNGKDTVGTTQGI